MTHYLDHAATSLLRPCVRDLLAQVASSEGQFAQPANPSSVHQLGQQTNFYLDDARRSIAEHLGAHAGWVVFASSGTEANNLALRGTCLHPSFQGKRLVISATEHACVRETAYALRDDHGVPLTELPVNAQGVVSEEALAQALAQGDVGLVSIHHANNETGVLQNISALVQAAKTAAQQDGIEAPFFHTDAVQTVGHVSVDMADLGVDMLTLSGHKFGGLQGAGALLAKPRVPMVSHTTGGGQERFRRAGTHNVLGILALQAALENAMGNINEEAAQQRAFQEALEGNLPEGITVAGHGAARVPHISQLVLPTPSDTAVMALDMAGFATSRGAACSSGDVKPSHVLQAMGYGGHALNGLRISTGWGQTADATEATVAKIHQVLSKITA